MEKIDKLDKQIMEIISANARIPVYPSRMLLPFAVYHGQPSINVFSV